MDGNYEINSSSLSLKTLCAVKVVRRVLLASAGGRFMGPTVEEDAAKGVRELELTRTATELLENLIPPMRKEMGYWHKMFYSSAEDLVMTPIGTVDWIQSAKVLLLNKKKNKLVRFAVACHHCFEDVIYKLFSGLTEYDWYCLVESSSKCPWFPMVGFWRNAFLGRFGPVSKGRLPQEAYNRGFEIAIYSQNDFAVKHFLNAASPEMVSQWSFLSFCLALDFFKFPSTFCLLVSKLPKIDQHSYLPDFASYLLLMLIDFWPYQRFFVEAAHSLTSHLTERNYWFIVKYVLDEIVEHQRDSDYYELFTSLWLAGSCHRHGSTTISCFSDVIFDILMFKNERLVIFVLNETCTMLKEEVLMKFSENEICIRLIFKKEFRMLEIFIRCCVLRGKGVLVEFKSNFLAYYSSYSDETWFEEFKGDWEAGLRQFAEIVEKIVAE